MQNRGDQVLALNIADWMLLDPALLAMRNRGLALPTLPAELSDSTSKPREVRQRPRLAAAARAVRRRAVAHA